MSSKRFFYVMIACVFLLTISVFGIVFLGNNILQNKSKKLVELKLESRLIEEQQLALIAANKDIDTYNTLDTIAKTIVPRDKDQAKAVRDIIQIAKENGIAIDSITFPTSTLGSKQAAPPTPATTEGAAAAAPIVPKDSQIKAVEGVSGVFSMQLDVTPSSSKPITYQEFINFLSRLENNQRTAQISRINITPKGDKITFTLSINIFIKP